VYPVDSCTVEEMFEFKEDDLEHVDNDRLIALLKHDGEYKDCHLGGGFVNE
jgi:hypothetical protein